MKRHLEPNGVLLGSLRVRCLEGAGQDQENLREAEPDRGPEGDVAVF